MENILTFIIPVRHQNNAAHWPQLKKNLVETLRSISRQDSKAWRAVIVANHGAHLPDLPKGFDVKRVDYPPNPLHRQGNAEKEQFYEAVRSDKGRRVLAGMLHVGEMGHVMIVDDDDLVSRRLTSFVEQNRAANGWFIRDGYVWTDGGKWLYRYGDFARLCGTSHIVRADLYKLPQTLEFADEPYIRRMLGSHIFVNDILANSGTPLAPLPFAGAVYRTGHSGSHSQAGGIAAHYFFQKEVIKKPWVFGRRLLRLHPKSRKMEREFFGTP